MSWSPRPFRRRLPSIELRMQRNWSALANLRAHLSKGTDDANEKTGVVASAVTSGSESAIAAALKSPTQPELFS